MHCGGDRSDCCHWPLDGASRFAPVADVKDWELELPAQG
jgi:hypothetical protein